MIDEFCYLNRRAHAYDYKIVDYDKRNKSEYMTISARGITHYIDNVGEFIKIERWE
jgi:dynein heavy chain, axonemal